MATLLRKGARPMRIVELRKCVLEARQRNPISKFPQRMSRITLFRKRWKLPDFWKERNRLNRGVHGEALPGLILLESV